MIGQYKNCRSINPIWPDCEPNICCTYKNLSLDVMKFCLPQNTSLWMSRHVNLSHAWLMVSSLWPFQISLRTSSISPMRIHEALNCRYVWHVTRPTRIRDDIWCINDVEVAQYNCGKKSKKGITSVVCVCACMLEGEIEGGGRVKDKR